MPIDPKKVKWDETPQIDPSAVQWDKASGQQPSAQVAQPQKQRFGTARNVGMGALKGVTDIGSTLLAPRDWLEGKVNALADKMAGKSGPPQMDRRAELANFYQENANPDSLAFQGGALTSQIAGTAGVGGALAGGARVIPGLAKFAPALESGGFKVAEKATTLPGKLANAAVRTGAGATVGGVSAGMVDPNQAGMGAVIGGAMPGALKVAGEVGKGVKKGVSSLAKNTVGLATGAGGDAVGVAYQSGKAGNRAFLENMRGKASADDIVAQAKDALQNMRAERAATYRSGMVDIKGDKSVVDFVPIKAAMSKVASMGSFKGQQINKNASGTVQELADTIDNWANLDPAEFHTPEGLDALKQAIGDIRDSTQFGSPGRKAADSVYNAVKAEINKQAPTYAKVMKEYSDASEALREVEKSFSLGEKASKDTSLRKLLSLMRNNVNTNFSNRKDLAQTLVDNGAGDLFPSIAGQSMSSATPRGLQGLAATGTGVYSLTNPAALAALPFQSPRLMGEAAYGLGRTAGSAASVGNGTAARLGLTSPSMLEIEQALARTAPVVGLPGLLYQPK
jgi:hypothetical protein